MAISQEEFGRRLDEKPTITAVDEDRYRLLSDRQFTIRVRDQRIPMLPLGSDDPLDPLEELQADLAAPYWADGKPGCQGVRPEEDLSQEQTGVKPQFGRSTCVAFASLAGIEHVLNKNVGSGGPEPDLSEQYATWLFMKNEGADQCRGWLHTKHAVEYLTQKGVCAERFWRYQNQVGMVGRCSDQPLPRARQNAFFGIKRFALIGRGINGPRIGNTDYLECLLNHGKSIVVAIDLAVGDEDPGDGIYDVLKDRSRNLLTSLGGHAMLLTGYDKEKETLKFKNSWGREADHQGYMWLSYDYVRQYAKYGYVILEVDTEMPVEADVSWAEMLELNLRLRAVDARYFVERPGTTVRIDLPKIPRTESTRNIGFKVKAVGHSVHWLEDEHISTDDYLLPGAVELRAGPSGIGHLVLIAEDHSNEKSREMVAVKPLVVTIDVRENGNS
jgi:hypothetical protein